MLQALASCSSASRAGGARDGRHKAQAYTPEEPVRAAWSVRLAAGFFDVHAGRPAVSRVGFVAQVLNAKISGKRHVVEPAGPDNG